jgi:ABC-2 type transport system permease protein
MRNFWIVAKHEYRRMVVRRGFILITLAIPLGLAVVIGLAIIVEFARQNKRPVAYVDHAGFLDVAQQSMLPNPEDQIEIRAYPDEATGLAALEQEEIQTLFVFPADYRQTLKTDIYYLEKPPSNDVWREFDDFVRFNLTRNLSGNLRERLLQGPDITVHDIASGREFSESALINVIIPIAASFFFFFATMSAAGYLLGVVADEKESRTMEIMLTTLSPGQLITGKAFGLLMASLTQLAIYIVAAVLCLKVAAHYVEFLQRMVVPWSYMGLMALFFFPAYTLIAAMMVAIGGAVNEMQQAQQVAGLVNMLFMAPIFLIGALLRNPGHPLMIFMTLFPTTSFLTISMRWGLGTIPVWQIGLSWILLVLATILMMWAAARIFRAGMLQYGQPLRLKAVVAALRTQ